MFSRRPLTHYPRHIRVINQWLSGLAYRTKWMIVVLLLAILSTTQLPEIFAQQVTTQVAAVAKRVKKQRIINLNGSSASGSTTTGSTLTPKKTSKHTKKPKVIAGVILSGSISTGTILPYTGSGQCIWDMAHMQWTGLQTYTGTYLSGGLLSGNRSLNASAWTGSWSGFDSQRKILSTGTGIMIHETLIHHDHYLAMRVCQWASGKIVYPTEQEYLSGLLSFSGELMELPLIFSGVQLIGSTIGSLSTTGGIINVTGSTHKTQSQTVAIESTSKQKQPGGSSSKIHTQGATQQNTRVAQSSQEFQSLIDQGVGVLQRQTIKRARDTGKVNKLQIVRDVVLSDAKNTLSTTIDSGTVLFTAQGQELQIDQFVTEELIKDTNPRSKLAPTRIEVGTPGDHLIFTQPVMIAYQSDLPDGSPVWLQVQHAGQDRSTQGLSLDPNANCDIDGNTNKPGSKTSVQGGQIIFYTCGASIFNFTYTGGANTGNFVDNGTLSKTVTIATGSVSTGFVISDLNVSINRQAIDSENPLAFGNTNSYPSEKSFTITSPGGVTRRLISTGTYTDGTTTGVVTILDDQAGALPSGLPVSGTFLPRDSLNSVYSGVNPIGTWTLTMGDNAAQDGVILHGFNLQIANIECGDSVIAGGEQCDDSNINNGDGCSMSCQVEAGRTCSGQPSSCSLIPSATGLLFHLDGSKTGALFRDIAGSGLDATAFNGVTTGNQNGETVMCFNGTNQYLERATNLVTTYPFTMSVWMKSSSITRTSGVMSFARSSATNRMYNIEHANTVIRQNAQNTTARYTNASTALTTTDWFLVTAVYSSATSRTIYVNGVSAGTNATNVTYDTNVTKRLNIGRLADSTPTNYFTGCVDDVRFYGNALTSGQVYSLYAKPANLTTSLVATGSPLLTGTIQGALDTIRLTISGTNYTGINLGNGTWSLSGGIISPALTNGTYVTTMLVTNPYGRAVTYTGSFVVSIPPCGDGVIVGAEQCDDSNTADGDGCSNACQIEPNWSCAGSPSVCTCANMQMDIVTTGDIVYSPYWGGFTASASVTNASASTITSRCVTAIGTNYSIVSNFNSTYTTSGSDITFCNVGYNGTLTPGASTTFGFNGDTGFPGGVQSPSHSSIQGDVTYSCQPAIAGNVCIYSPNSLSLSGSTASTGSNFEYQFDYFSVADTKGINSGYYATVSMPTLTAAGGATLSNSVIQWKGDPITVLSGTANPRVVVATGMQNYQVANTTTTFIKRDAAANSNVKGQYGSRLWVRVTVPSYHPIGSYTGTITYTLYEN